MQALFIGQTYIDVTFLTDRMPIGDEKLVASAYAISVISRVRISPSNSDGLKLSTIYQASPVNSSE